jgi:hypothetical protein
MRKAHETLDKAFSDLQRNYTNRSSAVFPVYASAQADTRIAFMNYWKHKNKIEDVVMNLRVYDAGGRLIARQSDKVSADSNDISIRQLLPGAPEDGMVEAEFISTANLRVPFPGINAFYLGRTGISAVHSAGRVYNSEETAGAGELRETNWSCVFQRGVSPFFFLFNGRTPRAVPQIRVLLRTGDCAIVGEKVLDPGIDAPFASRTFHLDELFPAIETGARVFAEVVVPVNGAFPRLIVGNYYREHDHHQVTHSFEWQTTSHFVRLPAEVQDSDPILSINPAARTDELDLQMVFYPTNSPAEICGAVRRAHFGGELEESGEELRLVTGGPGAIVVRHRVPANVYGIDFRSGDVPSRLNTSFEYSVRDARLPFFAEIASGGSALTVPRKFSCWGPAPMSNTLQTTLFVFNVANLAKDRGPNSAMLTLYLSGGETVSRELTLARESCIALNLGELLPNRSALGHEVRIAGWMIRFDRAVSRDTFWVAHDRDGQVVADHCF